jgi:NADPH:quinone reductase-like Zn-dependent oxidoreductase
MNDLFEADKIKPVIDGSYQLHELSDAFRLFGKGEHKGKIVIAVINPHTL